MIPHAFEEQQLEIRIAHLKPARQKQISIYVAVCVFVSIAGLAWTQHPRLGAAINLFLSVAVFSIDEFLGSARAREVNRRHVVAIVRKEWGLAVPEDASLEQVACILAESLPLRIQPRAEA
jgi:hypothetical protein